MVKIGKHLYESVERTYSDNTSVCKECAVANNSSCILMKDGVAHVIDTCNRKFGKTHYPVKQK